MKKYFKLIVFLTGFFSIFIFNSAALQAELIEPSRSLKTTAESPGRLTVFSEPPGLTVKLDGTTVGQAPMLIKDVEPGIHQLQVSESATEIYMEPGKTFHISLFRNRFIQFEVAKKEPAEPSGAKKLTTPQTSSPEPSSLRLRTEKENRKAWERWMKFINGSAKYF